MMEHPPSVRSNAIERVRAGFVPRLVAAGILLYFGFVRLAEPSGTGLFEQANVWFYHAVRIGGVSLAIVAAASATGHGTVLVADAVVSGAIGAVFIVTAGLMLIGGGDAVNSVLILVFGGLFVSEALREGHAFVGCLRGARVHRAAGVAEPRAHVSEPTGHHGSAGPVPGAPPLRVEARSTSTADACSVATSASPSMDPPSGYLAAFAKRPSADGAGEARRAGAAP